MRLRRCDLLYPTPYTLHPTLHLLVHRARQCATIRGWPQVNAQLTALALYLSEPASCVEREPEYLFNAIWQFAQDFDRAYVHVARSAEAHLNPR